MADVCCERTRAGQTGIIVHDGGASFIVKTNMFRSYDFGRAKAMVDRALAIED